MTILACRGTGKRVVISERNDPALQSLGPDIDVLRKWIYRHADVVTANSHGALRTMERYVPVSKLVYVPNPLHIPTTVRSAAQRDKVILTVARLHHQKGIDILLEAYRIVLDNRRDWRLCIVGDGEERQALQQQAARLGIATMIDWQGQVADVSPFLASASLFVLPSRHEGTPNALLEAMAYSMPVVVTDSSPGPVVAVGQAGCVVAGGNPAAIAETVLGLIKDETRRQKLGIAARALCHKYSLERVEDRWNTILGLTGKTDTRIRAGAKTNG